jgi:hypothetical protein
LPDESNLTLPLVPSSTFLIHGSIIFSGPYRRAVMMSVFQSMTEGEAASEEETEKSMAKQIPGQ